MVTIYFMPWGGDDGVVGGGGGEDDESGGRVGRIREACRVFTELALIFNYIVSKTILNELYYFLRVL